MRIPLFALTLCLAAPAWAIQVPVSDEGTANLWLGLSWTDGVQSAQEQVRSFATLEVDGVLDTDTLQIANTLNLVTGNAGGVMLETPTFDITATKLLPGPTVFDPDVEATIIVPGFHWEASASWVVPDIPEMTTTQLFSRPSGSFTGSILFADVEIDYEVNLFLNDQLLSSVSGVTGDSIIRADWTCAGPSSAIACTVNANQLELGARFQPGDEIFTDIIRLFPEGADIDTSPLRVTARVPEPHGALLLGLGLGAVAFLRRRDG